MACSKGVILSTLLLTSQLIAVPETIPWTGIDKLPYITPFVTYGHFGPLPSPSAHDIGIEGVNLDMALDRDIEIGFGLQVAETNRSSFLYNSFDWVFSMLFMNDLIGDPVSLMVSLGGKNVGGKALAEPALLHFGEWEWRATVAVGKEWTKCDDWWFRFSGYGTLGIANRGTPWIEAGATYEHRLNDCSRYAVGIGGLQAFGGRVIEHTPFVKGWGPYRFTLLSAFASYTQVICDADVTFSLERTFWTKHSFGNITYLSIQIALPTPL